MLPEVRRGLLSAWSPCLGPGGTWVLDHTPGQRDASFVGMSAQTSWTLAAGLPSIEFTTTQENKYLNAPRPYSPTDRMTWVCWHRPTSMGAYQGLICFWTSSSDRLILYRPAGSTATSLFSGAVGDLVAGLSDNTLNAWHCTIATMDFLSDTFKLYTNGNLSASTTIAASTPTASSYLIVGNFFTTGTTNTFSYQGEIAEVLIFNRILSVNEIKQLSTLPGIIHAMNYSADIGKAGAAPLAFKAAWLAGSRQTKIIGGGVR